MHRVTTSGALLIAVGLTACGGGGGGGQVTPPELPAHAEPTLALTASDGAHVAARAVAVMWSLGWIARTLADELDGGTPIRPLVTGPCGFGTRTMRYDDADRDGAISVGDTITLESSGCSSPAYSDGSAVATVLAATGGQLVDVRVDIVSGRLPAMSGYNWIPTISGTLRLTAHDTGFWVRSDQGIRFDVDAQEWMRASRIGLRLGDAPGNPPPPGSEGGIDLVLHTGQIGEGRLLLDTSGGMVAGHAANSAPLPGSYALRGSGGTRMTVADAGGTRAGDYRVRTDSTGSGVYDGDQIISFLEIFDPL